MEINQLTLAYFSPTLGTMRIALRIALALGLHVPTRQINLIDPAIRLAEYALGPDELLLFAAPTHDGRLPRLAPALLENITGSGTPAVPIVVYGGRGYDDALLEMKDLLEMNGFAVVAAAAFIAQHSQAPKVAAGRPNDKDIADMAAFGKNLRQKLDELDKSGLAQRPPLTIPGNFPYKEFSEVPIVPPSSTDGCTNQCMMCYRWCPTGAIAWDNPNSTDAEKCIHCQSCVARCPTKARILDDETLRTRILGIEGMFADIEMEIETFL